MKNILMPAKYASSERHEIEFTNEAESSMSTHWQGIKVMLSTKSEKHLRKIRPAGTTFVANESLPMGDSRDLLVHCGAVAMLGVWP